MRNFINSILAILGVVAISVLTGIFGTVYLLVSAEYDRPGTIDRLISANVRAVKSRDNVQPTPQPTPPPVPATKGRYVWRD